jgi:hypothetical protein
MPEFCRRQFYFVNRFSPHVEDAEAGWRQPAAKRCSPCVPGKKDAAENEKNA